MFGLPSLRELGEGALGRIGLIPEEMFDGQGNFTGFDGDAFADSDWVWGWGWQDSDGENGDDQAEATIPKPEDIAQEHVEETVDTAAHLSAQEDIAIAAVQKLVELVEAGDAGIMLAVLEAIEAESKFVVERMGDNTHSVNAVGEETLVIDTSSSDWKTEGVHASTHSACIDPKFLQRVHIEDTPTLSDPPKVTRKRSFGAYEEENTSGNEVKNGKETKRPRSASPPVMDKEPQPLVPDVASDEQPEILQGPADTDPEPEAKGEESTPLSEKHRLLPAPLIKCPCCEFVCTELTCHMIAMHIQKAHQWFVDIEVDGQMMKKCCIIDQPTNAPCGHLAPIKNASEAYRQAGRHFGTKHSKKAYFCRVDECMMSFVRPDVRDDHRRTMHKLDSKVLDAARKLDAEAREASEGLNIARGLMDIPQKKQKKYKAHAAGLA